MWFKSQAETRCLLQAGCGIASKPLPSCQQVGHKSNTLRIRSRYKFSSHFRSFSPHWCSAKCSFFPFVCNKEVGSLWLTAEPSSWLVTDVCILPKSTWVKTNFLFPSRHKYLWNGMNEVSCSFCSLWCFSSNTHTQLPRSYTLYPPHKEK